VEGTTATGGTAGCTTEFAVRDYSGKRGISSAGHCPDDLTDMNGVSLGTFAGQALAPFAGQDIQWHSSTAHQYPNRIQAGPNSVTITSITGRSLMYPAQTEVCLVRRTGAVPCGKIYSVNYTDPASGHGPYVAVRPPSSLVMTYAGDSGGPWFHGNSAFGSHVGRSPDGIAFFMPADRFSAASITVATN
jgi:hypothetical protein